MKMVHKKTAAAASMAALAVLGMTGCSSDSGSTASSSSSSSSSSTSASASADPAADLVGSGCAGYAEQVPDGAGSVSGMAKDPVATAASNNPLLKTLTSAVSGQLNPGVNLVDTLNGGEFTVIAPTDDAFAKIDAATLDKLKTDAPLLNSILTYHVIPGRLSPAQIAGTHKTVEGQDVVVTGSGEGLKFDDDTAALVCGGVQTANATVYMVDTVMMPPAGGAPAAGGTGAPGAGAGPGGATATAPGGTGAGAGPGGATAVVPGASAGAGPGGAGANVPGAGANAGPGGAGAVVPGAGAEAGPGGAGVQVPGAGANAGPGGASACVNGVCVGAGG